MGDIELQIFADRLKELRSDLGLTQAEFVDGLGITSSALSSYEKNIKNPSIIVAKKIAEKYNVSIDWLCGLSNRKAIVDESYFHTYADIFRYVYNKDSKNFTGLVTHYIASIEKVARQFSSEYNRMLELRERNVIDHELFDLWIEKNLQEFDIQIGKNVNKYK